MLLDEVNNSGKEAKWLKSNIPNEGYVCSLCGGASWQYDALYAEVLIGNMMITV